MGRHPYGWRTQTVLAALSTGPKTCAEIAVTLSDASKYVSRTMNELVVRGSVVNLKPGRHRRAVYALRGPSA
jgi:predicted transcriptional regulator